MNLNLPGVVVLAIGVVLIFAAKNNKDPRDIVLEALGQSTRYGPLAKITAPRAGGFATADMPAPTTPNQPGTIWVSV